MRLQDIGYDSLASIQRARQQQLQSLMAMRSNFQYSSGSQDAQGPGKPKKAQGAHAPQRPQPTQRSQGLPPGYGGGGYGPVDSVTLGGRTYNAGSGPIDVNDTRMQNGQTIEELFANPYGNDPDMGYLQEALDKIAAAKALYGTKPSGSTKEGQKGDLRVIAGDRRDGVKPKEVRIDDANNYETQKAENGYHDNRQETRFKDGTVGREYDVTVTWEDGTTTKKRVKLKQPGQIVYMDSAY